MIVDQGHGRIGYSILIYTHIIICYIHKLKQLCGTYRLQF